MIGLCLLAKLICAHSLIEGLWRAVGQDVDLQRVLFVSVSVIQAGGKEAEGQH